ncbi:MAG TPA: peptide chain release factor N(5)-glutamine methyltransferase [Blastocatellia bacterium]|jgi:release factor glutamine methyltransferase|nr:peptide chain release factor N(5)-glutamine methyltransferase [Blastocatellia bacterium]
MTIDQAIQEGADRLRNRQVDEHRRTAALLLGHLLGLDRAQLFIRSKEQLNESIYSEYSSLIERRASGEPLQYITRHQEFYGLDFLVTPDVLIPRPETELLVERLIALAGESESTAPLIVDIGTGSGCIAIALATHLRAARVIAIDVSPASLVVARTNAERHNVRHQIEFIQGDLFQPLSNRGFEAAIDFVASNPPYVAEGSADTLQPEVRDWEPPAALFGGEAGLGFYERLLAQSQRFVGPGRHLVCEIGYGQLDAISNMIDPAAWKLVDITADLQGIPRILTVRRNS